MENRDANTYYVFIVTNSLRNLWNVSITVNLSERLRRLERGVDVDKCKYLVYYEEYREPLDSVDRETKLWGYSQRKLRKLVETQNPEMKFLNDDWL